MKHLIFSIVFITATLLLRGQETGSLRVIADPRLDTLQQLNSRLHRLQQLEGFRIQIFMESGNDAVVRADQAINRFKEAFPAHKTYLTFGQPYYRVRIGDFRTRLEAEGQLNIITRFFPQAFIIKDIVEPPLLPSFPSNTIEP
jgi:hypothetical protein